MEARRKATGYALIVQTGDRWTRRVYLSMRSATEAADRARDRGAEPFVIMVRMTPTGEATR